jgi:pimeloyl-ACP methyl ester carboxylesterase
MMRKMVLPAALIAACALLGCAGGRDKSPPPVSAEPAAQPASPATSGIPVRQGQVKANGITIAYESFGPEDRETVLLVMGAAAQLTAWHVELCEELVRRGYRVIRYDNRDVGLSTRFETAGMPDFAAVVAAAQAGKPAPLAYTLDDMAKDAVGLLDALGIRRAHIVGPSMGGMIGQIIAADYPDRALSLTSIMASSGKPGLPIFAKPEVLAKIPPPAPEGDKKAYIERQIKLLQLIGSQRAPIDEKTLREWVIRDVDRSYYPAGEARHAAVSLFAVHEDRRPKLKTIKAPTVVVHGEDDPLVAVEAGRDVAVNIPGAEFRLVPGLGHVIPVALVKTFADAITAAASRAGPAALRWSGQEDRPPALRKVAVGDGVELHYVERGKGVAVLFVHGTLGDYSAWDGQLGPFAETYRALAYSRRYNHPNTNKLRPKHSAVVEAEDLAAFIRKVDLGKVHVVGHSYGGYAALFLAMKHPDLVRTLTLAEPPVVFGGDRVGDDRERVRKQARAAFAKGDAEGAVRVVVSSGREGSYDKIPEPFRKLLLRNARELEALVTSEEMYPAIDRDAVRKIAAPTLLLSGEKSAPSQQATDKELERLLPEKGRRRATIRGADHGMWFQKPEECRKAVLEFLRGK